MIVPKFKEIIEDAARTPAGKDLFWAIFHLCEAGRTSLAYNGVNVNIEGTLHNEAMRVVYLQLRKHIPDEILQDIEFRKIIQSDGQTKTDEGKSVTETATETGDNCDSSRTASRTGRRSIRTGSRRSTK